MANEDGRVYEPRPHSPPKPNRAFVLVAKALEVKNAEFSAHVQRGDVRARAVERFLERFVQECQVAADDIATGRPYPSRVGRAVAISPRAPEATLHPDLHWAEVGAVEQKTRGTVAGRIGVGLLHYLEYAAGIARPDVRGHATLIETATGRTPISPPFRTGAAARDDQVLLSEDLRLICRRMLSVLAR